jgi:hypothetical protein
MMNGLPSENSSHILISSITYTMHAASVISAPNAGRARMPLEFRGRPAQRNVAHLLRKIQRHSEKSLIGKSSCRRRAQSIQHPRNSRQNIVFMSDAFGCVAVSTNVSHKCYFDVSKQTCAFTASWICTLQFELETNITHLRTPERFAVT